MHYLEGKAEISIQVCTIGKILYTVILSFVMCVYIRAEYFFQIKSLLFV